MIVISKHGKLEKNAVLLNFHLQIRVIVTYKTEFPDRKLRTLVHLPDENIFLGCPSLGTVGP